MQEPKSQLYQLFPVYNAPGQVIDLAQGRGKLYRKQLVRFASWVNPQDRNKKMVLDRTWGEKVAENFRNKVIDHVPVPLGHPRSAEELAALTRGELIDVEVQDDGLYGLIDVRSAEAAKAIDDGNLWDVSVSFEHNYLDKLMNKYVGPALMHVGLVNDPYLKGMKAFEALSLTPSAIMLSESKEAFMVPIKNEREFPVELKYTEGGVEKTVTVQPGANVELPQDVQEAVTKQLADAVAPKTPEQLQAEKDAADKAEADRKAAEDKAAADAKAKADAEKTTEERQAELEAENAKLKNDLSRQAAETKYTEMLSAGKITPAMKDAYIGLSQVQETTVNLSDGKESTVAALLADLFDKAPKLVSLSEEGKNGGDADTRTPWQKLSDEEREKNTLMGVTEEDFNKYGSDSIDKPETGKENE